MTANFLSFFLVKTRGSRFLQNHRILYPAQGCNESRTYPKDTGPLQHTRHAHTFVRSYLEAILSSHCGFGQCEEIKEPTGAQDWTRDAGAVRQQFYLLCQQATLSLFLSFSKNSIFVVWGIVIPQNAAEAFPSVCRHISKHVKVSNDQEIFHHPITLLIDCTTCVVNLVCL